MGTAVTKARGYASGPRQARRHDRTRMLRVVGVALVPSRPALEEHEREDERQHGERDLRRTRQIGACDPGRIDRDRQRADAHELGGADIVQGLHQRQAEADGNRRPRERQGNADERLRAREAERAAGFDQAGRLHREERPRRQIDVRVEHEAQNDACTPPWIGCPAGGNLLGSRTRAPTAGPPATGPTGWRMSR